MGGSHCCAGKYEEGYDSSPDTGRSRMLLRELQDRSSCKYLVKGPQVHGPHVTFRRGTPGTSVLNINRATSCDRGEMVK